MNLAKAGAVAGVMGGVAMANAAVIEYSQRPSSSQATDTYAFVSDDLCIEESGCDSVSVVDASSAVLVHRGSHLYCSPGRLAADAMRAVVVAQPANQSNAIQVTTRWIDGTGSPRFSERIVRPVPTDRPLAVKAAIALSRDGEELILAKQASSFNGSAAMGPFWIERYSMPSDDELGAPLAERAITGVPIEFAYAADGRTLLVLTHSGELYSVDAKTLEDINPPLSTIVLASTTDEIGRVHATIDPDQLVAVSSVQDERSRVLVVDIGSRVFEWAPLLPGDRVWGLALNLAPHNHHMLAVYRSDSIEFYALRSNGLDFERSVTAVTPDVRPPGDGTLQGAVAWDAAGDVLITASSDEVGFQLFRIGAGRVDPIGAASPCGSPGSGHAPLGMPGDIVAGNEWSGVPRPSDTPTAPTDTPTPAPSPSPTTSISPWTVFLPSIRDSDSGPAR